MTFFWLAIAAFSGIRLYHLVLLNVFARKKRMKKEHAALGVMTSLPLSFVASFPSLVTVLVDLVLTAFLAHFGQRPQRAPKSLRPVGYRDEFPNICFPFYCPSVYTPFPVDHQCLKSALSSLIFSLLALTLALSDFTSPLQASNHSLRL